MTQTVSGRPCVYADFRGASRKPRRTERAQRQEIEASLDRLTQQGDFWSLDVIRRAATTFAADDAAGQDLYSLLWEIITAKPGAWIVRRKAPAQNSEKIAREGAAK